MEEHLTEDGFKIYFNTLSAFYMEHRDPNYCIIIICGLAITIRAPYETMKLKAQPN